MPLGLLGVAGNVNSVGSLDVDEHWPQIDYLLFLLCKFILFLFLCFYTLCWKHKINRNHSDLFLNNLRKNERSQWK